MRRTDCTVGHSDQLVKEESSQRYLFPDVVVHCKQGRLEKGAVDTVLDLIVVIEVLSPTTERMDRTKKFESYSKIASLKELVLVGQDRQIVEHFWRDSAEEAWRVEHLFDDEHVLVLESVGCKVGMAEIYEGVER